MKKVAINGFGRIGRMVFRNLFRDNTFEVVAINASYTPEQLGHLIQYDSIHGRLDCEISYKEKSIVIDGKEILILQERNPSLLPWKKLGVTHVIESTGAFRTVDSVSQHITAGAEKVVLTAPAKDDMKMIVMGVNEDTYQGEAVVSNASCTTNCLAPITKAIHESFGIENGLITTIHSYTNDQNVLDNPHKDLRRARACGMSMIPTSTGAAKAIGKIIPSLDGKLNGTSIRVPTPNVSLVDLVIDVKQDVTKEEINTILEKASKEHPSIIGYNELPLVSIDYTTDPRSTIVDGLSTMVIGNRKVKILAWYDNEWGYSCRVVDLLRYISK